MITKYFKPKTDDNAKSHYVQSCKLYDNKYMIASTQITNTEIFAFITVLVFMLLSRKVLFIIEVVGKRHILGDVCRFLGNHFF